MSTKERAPSEERVLVTRIIAEYLEMPGLVLTLPQACRLWQLQPAPCERLLDTLVASNFLCKHGECYLRAGGCRSAA